MTSTGIRQWFTPERLEKLDLQKIEDLAGITRSSIAYHINGIEMFKDEQEPLSIVLKMIENGFNDCNK